MKKIIVVVGIVLICALAILKKDTIQEVFFGSNLPEPTSIAFEKQLPLYSYDWQLLGIKGRPISFVEYMNRNVIINYWSPNSEESVAELEVWAKLYEDYKNDIFFIFATDDSQADVNKFIKEKGYVFPIFYSASTPLRTMVLDKAPKTYLITKKGRVVVNHSGAANWNSENFRKVLDGIIKK
jgi:hypothetical protein